jgi:hypothetical protein
MLPIASVLLLGFGEFPHKCPHQARNDAGHRCTCPSAPSPPVQRRAYLATGERNAGETATWDGPPGWFAVGYDIYTDGPPKPNSLGEFVLWGMVGMDREPTWADLIPMNADNKWQIVFSDDLVMSTTEACDVSFWNRKSRFNGDVPCEKLTITGSKFDAAQDIFSYISVPYLTCEYPTGGRPYDPDYSARFEADPMAVDLWQFQGNRFDRVPQAQVPLDSDAATPAGNDYSD